MARYIVVGGVAGGMSAAARLRRLSEHDEIIVFEKDSYVSYANCGLPYYIGGVISDRDKLFVQTPDSLRKRFNIDVRINNQVLWIDSKKKIVGVKDLLVSKEYTEYYDKLILSPGAIPVMPNIKGIEIDKVFKLRNVDDADRIKVFVDKNNPKRVLIIGAGYIGLEVAENLHKRGMYVTIVELDKQVMPLIDYEMASIVHDHLKMKGIEFYLSDAVVSLSDENNKVRVELKSGRVLFCDMVVVSVGVRPNVELAKSANLRIGDRGGILVNEYLQTSDPDIYAIGDAIEVKNFITGKSTIIPLAGPANKQGRIVADNIVYGNKVKYDGTIGNGIVKVFDLTVGVTGLNEKVLNSEGTPYEYTIVHSYSHATYYPDSLPLSLKVIFSPADGKILGAQCVGFEGVDKRIDVITSFIQKGGTIYDLVNYEQGYAPPYSSAKDPVNLAGFTADNIIKKLVKPIYWNEIDSLDYSKTVLIDVRTDEEFKQGTIKNAINIPVDQLRNRLEEIPRDKEIVVFCRVGLRGYIASRILLQNGYENVRNLVGGYLTYYYVTSPQGNPNRFGEEFDTGLVESKVFNVQPELPRRKMNIDACGLHCPGPILKVKEGIEMINVGDLLEVKATDPGFYNDVISWAKVTGNKIVSINMEKGVINALIEKGTSVGGQPQKSVSGEKTIIVFDNNLDKVIASFIIANGAIAMGKKVTMFFTFWGLSVLRKQKSKVKKNFMERIFGIILPKGTNNLKLSKMNMFGIGPLMIRWLMKKKKVQSLESMIENAIKNGVKIVACQMSMDLLGIKKEELIDGVEIGGVAYYLEATENSNVNLFI
ncbi:MAG: FAD-dependent oxidoreductase [Brevinematia bacterium]